MLVLLVPYVIIEQGAKLLLIHETHNLVCTRTNNHLFRMFRSCQITTSICCSLVQALARNHECLQLKQFTFNRTFDRFPSQPEGCHVSFRPQPPRDCFRIDSCTFTTWEVRWFQMSRHAWMLMWIQQWVFNLLIVLITWFSVYSVHCTLGGRCLATVAFIRRSTNGRNSCIAPPPGTNPQTQMLHGDVSSNVYILHST